MFVGDWAARGASYFSSREAIVDDATGRRFTYADMDARSDGLGRFLRARGVRKGDRVGVLAYNGVEYFDLLFACGKLGAVLVPFNWRLTRHELTGLVALTTPSVLFASRELAETAATLGVPVVDLGAPEMPSPAYDAALATPGAPVREDSLDAEDTAVLLFTGGTTGLPKAVRLSHRMIAWNILTTTVHHVRHEDVTAVHTPMFHTGGLFVHAVPVLTLGGKVVVMRRWDADQMLEIVGRERLTVLFCVPSQFQQMAACAAFAKTDFSKMRMLVSGGAPLPVQLQREYEAVHSVPMTQGFGMTEFGPNALMLSAEDAKERAGSVGKPNYFVDARVLGDDGEEVLAGDVGELCLRGGGLFSGYFGLEESHVDARGWFHTGDLARVDEHGFFHIAGRSKDMFISGGENVYPVEIEDVLYTHPAVAQCAVVGVHDERWGEVGRAFVVKKADATVDEETLLAHVRQRLAKYKVPKTLVLLDALPMSAAGKILKTALRERA